MAKGRRCKEDRPSMSESSQNFTFGAGTATFGSSEPVGSTSSIFGSTSGTAGLFGQNPTTQTFGSSEPVGSTSSIFGSTSGTGLFGHNPTTQTFGSGLSFGSTSSLFGGFGSTPTPGPFGQESSTREKSSNSGTDVKFVVVKGTDSIIKNGITINMSVRYQCITFMSTYNRKSLEVCYKDTILNAIVMKSWTSNLSNKETQGLTALD